MKKETVSAFCKDVIPYMKFGSIFKQAKNGQTVELRNAERTDAAALIDYLRITSGETPYLIREPEEVTLTPEQEQHFLQSKIESERELLLIALIDGKHIGNCTLMQLAPYRRYAHRCAVAIALYQAYCGLGIGRIMLETVLETAKKLGYEQAELEVMAENRNAIALYESLGFQRYGIFPHSMKYPDRHYDDAFWMMKRL